MKVVSSVISEPLVRLSTVAPGRVIRFQGFTYEECLLGGKLEDNHSTFYMVVKNPKDNNDRKTLVSLDGLSMIERDGVSMVYVHEAETAVHSN